MDHIEVTEGFYKRYIADLEAELRKKQETIYLLVGCLIAGGFVSVFVLAAVK
jgi:hypothetical protein